MGLQFQPSYCAVIRVLLPEWDEVRTDAELEQRAVEKFRGDDLSC